MQFELEITIKSQSGYTLCRNESFQEELILICVQILDTMQYLIYMHATNDDAHIYQRRISPMALFLIHHGR